MGSTATQKIFSRAAGRTSVRVGEEVVVRPDHALAYDFPGYSDRLLQTLQRGADSEEHLPRPGHRVMFIDHLTTRRSERIDAVHAQTRAGSRRFGFEVNEGSGIGHQVTCEMGWARPGALLVHFDPHVAVAGAQGALGIGVGYRYEPIWATGQWQTQVPPAVAVEMRGCLSPGVDARDLIHQWIRLWGADLPAGAVLEIRGATSSGLGLDALQGLCGMSIFTGALSALVLPSGAGVPELPSPEEWQLVLPDEDAPYAQRRWTDLDQVVPLLALPGSCQPTHIEPVEAHGAVRITRAFVGSCASGRLEDLRSVASVVRGRRVAPGVRFVVTPITLKTLEAARSEGLLAVLEEAGVEVQAPSCDPCYGFAHPLRPGEVCVSSGTLNVKGRMGSDQADIYLASPASVAAAAVAGHLQDPRELRARRAA